jgi:imidazolonepropionase
MGLATGIPATVMMTRAASEDELAATAERRLRHMLAYGATTVESKSGYGLSLEQELKMLRVNRRVQAGQPVDVVSTFLGAHDFPPEMSRDRYLEVLIQEMIPQVAEANLATFCDVYCDEGYYTVEETRRILEAGIDAGLVAKIHVDAYADIGGVAMAAELGVVSADHLNYTGRRALRQLATAGVIGVVMPALDFAVQHPHPFDSRAMMDEGLTLALATDFCPACWVDSMQLVMALACRLYRFSPEEALVAATAGGAQALALTDRGTIEPGKLADLQLWAVPSLDDVIYRLGSNAVSMVIKRGRVFEFGGQQL